MEIGLTEGLWIFIIAQAVSGTGFVIKILNRITKIETKIESLEQSRNEDNKKIEEIISKLESNLEKQNTILNSLSTSIEVLNVKLNTILRVN